MLFITLSVELSKSMWSLADGTCDKSEVEGEMRCIWKYLGDIWEAFGVSHLGVSDPIELHSLSTRIWKVP